MLLGHRSQYSDCGYDVPSMMNVLDLEELNGSPGDKRKI